MLFVARPSHLLAVSALLLSAATIAQAPAAKPANATGQCKDGTYSTAASKSGACRGHNGVKDWYAAAATPAPISPATKPGSSPPGAQAAMKPAVPASDVAPARQAANSSRGPRANLADKPVAPGGGPGLVWVNTTSNVYHCPGTDFYGKTKAGSYMSESSAKAKGARPDHGNPCSK